jgi:hypothetical protein
MKTQLKIFLNCFCFSLFLSANFALAQADDELAEHSEHALHQHMNHEHPNHANHQDLAPIGIMGGHMHSAGQWMFSVRMMGGGMSGLLDQTSLQDEQKVLDGFQMSPRTMLMGMPMLGIMYAPTDWLTLMGMVPGMAMRMEHVGHEVHMHTMQTTPAIDTGMNSVGLGDISVNALLGNWQWQEHHLHFNLGLSMPTGAIDIPSPAMQGMPSGQPLPYTMRLGSGTWDLLPGFTYTGQSGPWGWGLQPGTTLRLGNNSLSYHLGHRFSTSGWASYRWTDWLSTSLRLQGQIWGNAEGADSRLDKTMIPSADPARLGGQRLDLLLGANFYPWPGQRIGLEAGLPIYQSLSGPQLAQQWLAQLGWQMAF